MLVVAAVFSVARPASAQEKGAVNLGFTYDYLSTHYLGTHLNFPIGWAASFADGISKHVSLVGEVGGNYKKNTFVLNGVTNTVWSKQHTYQGGLRWLSTKNPKMTPFVQVLTGGEHSFALNTWTLSPGGGVDTNLRGRCAFRVQADFMFRHRLGVIHTNYKDFRIGAGIALKLGKK